jgi:hypothetical protein
LLAADGQKAIYTNKKFLGDNFELPVELFDVQPGQPASLSSRQTKATEEAEVPKSVKYMVSSGWWGGQWQCHWGGRACQVGCQRLCTFFPCEKCQICNRARCIHSKFDLHVNPAETLIP